MRRRLLLVTLCFALLALIAASSTSAATKVFLLAGQSNMSGVGGYSGYIKNSPPWSDPPYDRADVPCPAPYNVPLAAVRFWDFGYGKKLPDFVNEPEAGNGWVDLQPGFGYRSDQFGPELSFGRRLHELFPNDEIYLIKHAIGGTNLANDWNSNPAAMGPQYRTFQTRVKAALADLKKAGKKPTVVGMIWMQGENDTTVPEQAKAYPENLRRLIVKVRSDFDAPDMKFVAGRISTMSKRWATPENLALVRKTQEDISRLAKNTSWIDTDDLSWAYYGHYGTKGQIELRLRFANEFAPASTGIEPPRP